MNPKKLLTLKNTGYWKAAYGSSYQSKGKDGKDKLTTTHFEVFPLSPNDNVLFLPPTDTITPYYNIFNSIETPITEIHIPNATPTLYDCINFVNDIDKRDITLYVPYGCRDAYERNGVYNVYKDIKEDSLEGRVYATFIGAWDIIGRNVGSIWLTFILPILLLIILSTSFVIYKYKQAVSNKKVKSKKTIIIKSVLYCIVFSILAFIPAFWLVFYLFTCKIGGLSFVLILILSILAGLLAAVFCIYLFIFAGKGNIFTRNQ
ncbi:MAG: hypothetical protein IK092_03410 [Muribaculaceae bacterium]|nr:hypothetical protein [Muribaculaceae bacterium]